MYKIIIATAILSSSLLSAGQDIPPAPADKAVVYFARVSSLGFAINFRYFDSATLIGKANGTNYIRYECAPGPHLFWVKAENRDFVEADLEPGKIYFLEAEPRMGALRAAAGLEPLDPQKPDDQKRIGKILKMIARKAPESTTAEELEKDSKLQEDAIKKGLEKYKEEKDGGKKMARLEKNMYYTSPPAD